MSLSGKILGLLLASLALASCGGGGGSDGGAFSPPESSKLELSATRTTLPVNVWGYEPIQYGNPTQAEVTMTWRNPDGSLVNGQDIHVSIAPTNIAVLSCLVDGDECTDGNALFGSMVVKGTNGRATIFVNSFTTAGTATFTATGTDPNTNRSVSATLTFKVVSGTGTQPASIQLSANPGHVYLPGSGASSSSMISALIYDGAGQLVPDPATGNGGFDNIQFEVVGGASRGTLSTTSVAGPVSGAVVTSHTVHGIANASFSAGSEQGPVQIKATTDRADGNVSNGITDPVSSTITVVVSDGELFSLVLTSPTTDDITVNPVSDNVSSEVVPPSPDGSYSMTVSALATDRQGNPVPPGTVIEFGLVDSPMSGFPTSGAGAFLIMGNDGNPQEGGKLFTAPGGHFRTAGGGTGPGDTLLVFGKQVEGNSDLESARQVATVNSETSLTVTYPFNPNDTTGHTVDYGPVLPYVIGRAQEGNIGARGTTDANGVARTTLNYPVSRLGKGAYIWARGAGAPVNGTPRLVTTISGGGFAGVAPGYLVVDQTPITGNAVVPVEVCLYDALGAPIQGVHIRFGFSGLGAGTGSVDGQAGSGRLATPTGGNGCAIAVVATSGVVSGGESEPELVFSAGARVPALRVPIAPPEGGLVLQAAPSTLGGSGGLVTLSLADSSGNPVSGAQIGVSCEAGASAGLIAPTDANGRTSVTITGDLDAYGSANSAKCTFTQGEASAEVTLQGRDLCSTNPTHMQCADVILQAVPSSLGGSGGRVVLYLTDAGGGPIAGIKLQVACTAGASAGVVEPTNASGQTAVTISANLDSYGEEKSATCTFTSPAPSQASTVVYVQGSDLCTPSSSDPRCGDAAERATLSLLILDETSGGDAVVSIGSTPAGINPASCRLTATASAAACSATFDMDQLVALSVTGGSSLEWGGECTGSGAVTTVTMSGNKSCTLTVKAP